VFVTLTAPSFGTVHTRHVSKHTCTDRRRCDCRPDPCHARRDTPAPCEHGQPAVCWTRHERDDPALGQPLCLDCYDHDRHVVFNSFAAELWHRTKQTAERTLAKLCRARKIPFVPVVSPTTGKVRWVPPVRLSHGKAAEMQRRGAIHFHALIRLDGVDADDLDAVVPPPPGIGLDDFVDALTDAARTTGFSTPEHPDRADGWPMAWGEQLDIQRLTLTGDGSVTDQLVADHLAKAGYLAKYATKSTEATGHNSTRITADTIDQHADPAGSYTARLIAACWRLGHDPDDQPAHRTGLLRGSTGPTGGPFIEPWDCPNCGTHTRYRVCPRCAAERQASLDTKAAHRTEPANPYARLRRWAHMLGYGGHFLTKARRYSVTFRLLRETRITFRRTADRDQAAADLSVIRTADHQAEETSLIVGALTFAGVGWHTTGDALLANTAAALARSRHDTGREELAHEIGSNPTVIKRAA
jgi:hypothetical protein